MTQQDQTSQPGADEPVLEVISLPRQIRHGAVIGSFESLQPGGTLVIRTPRDPLPLLGQLRDRFDVGVDYLQSGPTQWLIRLTRR